MFNCLFNCYNRDSKKYSTIYTCIEQQILEIAEINLWINSGDEVDLNSRYTISMETKLRNESSIYNSNTTILIMVTMTNLLQSLSNYVL